MGFHRFSWRLNTWAGVQDGIPEEKAGPVFPKEHVLLTKEKKKLLRLIRRKSFEYIDTIEMQKSAGAELAKAFEYLLLTNPDPDTLLYGMERLYAFAVRENLSRVEMIARGITDFDVSSSSELEKYFKMAEEKNNGFASRYHLMDENWVLVNLQHQTHQEEHCLYKAKILAR